ncbi:MAG: hypothetical protein QF577_06940 [Phycisphaerae bacterium]|nr:hypothetical protein [Phycisphaerae bacterium]
MGIYAAFTLWLVFTIFAGVGVYRMWAALDKPAWVNWALLPGTVVSEMAYIFGCLITGGEIQKAKLVPDAGNSGSGEPKTSATPRWKFIGPIIASLIALVASGAAILVLNHVLGQPVMEQFRLAVAEPLKQELPTTWDGLWIHLSDQLRILRGICEMCPKLQWKNWRVGLFVYLAICLTVRLGPVSRPIHATLGAAIAASAVIALIGVISGEQFAALIKDIWPLLTFMWASLMLLLVGTLIVRGLTALWKILAGKDKGVK